MKQVGEQFLSAKIGGALLTQATNSTTRKVVGPFASAQININQNENLPLLAIAHYIKRPVTTQLTS